MVLARYKVKKLLKEGWNLGLASRIQPHGNIDFNLDDRYWIQGDGYHAALTITDFPTSGLGQFWGTQIMKIEGTRSFLMAYRMDSKDVEEQAAKAVEEKGSRIDDKARATKNQKELDEARALMEMEQSVRVHNEGTFGFAVKIFTSADTEEGLFTKIRSIKDSASRFKMTQFLGEQDIEFESVFVPADKQKLLPNHRNMHPILLSSLAAGYFFNHTSLSDPYGCYMGFTPTNGAVNFDMLHFDQDRTRPIMIISGNPKMHQKKFLLKNTDNLYSRGHKIINIDLDGTFINQTNRQCGKIINIDDARNKLNIMQVFASATDRTGLEVDEVNSFKLHVAKIRGFIQAQNPNLTSEELGELQSILTKFYRDEEELWNPNSDKKTITTFKPNQYPKLSDFLTFLSSEDRSLSRLEPGSTRQKATARIKTTFDNIFKAHGDLFDTYTTFKDFSDEQVITIDLSTAAGDQQLLNMQLFQILSLVSSYIITNGKKQSQKKSVDKTLREGELPHYIINISAAHKVIDPRFTESIQYLADMVESMVSNYGGLVLEMSSLQNILLQDDGRGRDPYINAVRRIFALTQYRVFSKVDESTVRLIADALQGSMSKSELETLPKLSQGGIFMNIEGYGNIVFKQDLSQKEEEWYYGIE
ncbi:TPA: virulence factor [Streptococcus suis]